MGSRSTRIFIKDLPPLLAWISVTIAGLIDLEGPYKRIIALVLLVLFAVILFVPFKWPQRMIFVHIRLTILSALTAGLLILRPGWGYFPILFFILSPLAMINLPLKAGLAWIGGFTFITGIVYSVVNGPSGLTLLLPYAAGFFFFGVFGWVSVEADRNRARSEQLLAELQTAHQRLQEYAAQVEELTIAEERNRIAREMHDTLGHRLTIAAVQLEGAQRLIRTNPDRAGSILGTVREQIKESLSDLRRTVAMLRASVEEDLPLDIALTRLVDQIQQATALKIHLNLEGCPTDIKPSQHLALYRAAQEGLTNIQRHARASEAWLQLITQDDMIQLLISDNGIGISAEEMHSGFGLVGLKERAALQGGEFHLDARAGGGTQMTFCIPLEQKNSSTSQPVICTSEDEKN
jgi:signal transduction histidine kinase